MSSAAAPAFLYERDASIAALSFEGAMTFNAGARSAPPPLTAPASPASFAIWAWGFVGKPYNLRTPASASAPRPSPNPPPPAIAAMSSGPLSIPSVPAPSSPPTCPIVGNQSAIRTASGSGLEVDVVLGGIPMLAPVGIGIVILFSAGLPILDPGGIGT